MRASVAAVTFAGAASASPTFLNAVRDAPMNVTSPASGNLTTTSREPCALVSQQWQQSAKGDVDSDLAYQCLRSVPLDAEGAALQMEGIKTMVQFQSTLAYLKTPPEGYLYPGVDIVDGLDQITDSLAQGKYSNEYDFQIEVQKLIGSAYDGHFAYISDIADVFKFIRELSLYSWSKDGISLPELYVDLPLLQPQNATSRNNTASPVAAIDGEDAQSWLIKQAAIQGSNQDPDANYNFMTPGVAQGGTTGGFAYSPYYLGPHTNVTFKNGTTSQIAHFARSKYNLTGIVDGPSFFEKLCTPEGKDATASQPEAPSNTSTATLIPTTPVPFKAVPSQTAFPGYPGFRAPGPYIISDDGIIAGYFPDEEPDLAVLAISSFGPQDPLVGSTQFSNVVRMFLASAQSAGRTRLAIDLRDNPGGQITLAYDLFAQLFPSILPYGATNFHAVPFFDDLGRIVSQYYSNVTEETASPEDCYGTYASPPYNYRNFLDMDNREFTSWDDFYGPKEHYGDNFTSIVRYDLNDKYSVQCTNISNYRNEQNITPPVFQPEDVFLVQNGVCGSTCAIFSEFMKTQAKTKQVVFGGRKQTGPMQAVGSVKGAQVLSFEYIPLAFEQVVYNDSTPAQAGYVNNTYGDLYEPATYALSRASMSTEGKAATFNLRNNIREGDDSATPLQFIYEAADCRLFFTRDMYTKQSLIWQAAYNAIWNGAACVEGSTGHPSSVPGTLGPFSPPKDAYVTDTVFPSDLTPDSNNASTANNGSMSSGSPAPPPYQGSATIFSVSRSTMGLAGVAIGLAVLV